MGLSDSYNSDLLKRAMQARLSSLSGTNPPQRNTLSQILSPSYIPRPVIKLAKPKVFVSFDYENDRRYKFLLEAWNENSSFQFTFHDKTPEEIQSNDIGRIKAVLTTKIQEAKYTLVLVGRYANQLHPDSREIGCVNWIQFEVQQSIMYKKKFVAVLLEPNNRLPDNIIGQPGTRVDSFNQQDIINALSHV